MGRLPCCDNVVIKKGPWTPEEDIVLVSYIQQHGPGNWRSVPINTGLMRCSKSCRLRWTNYLRPGIKRGSFTPQEEGMIIHLQGLLGNRWAAIASYLPQRTDNDIKNYWNTHLRKKLKELRTVLDAGIESSASSPGSHQHLFKACSREFMTLEAHSSLPGLGHGSSSTYASSTENISRLLERWKSSTPKAPAAKPLLEDGQQNDGRRSSCCYNLAAAATVLRDGGGGGVGVGGVISQDELESLFLSENVGSDGRGGGLAWHSWLLDDFAGQEEGLIELSTTATFSGMF